jgi:hypothetical protein
MKNKPQVKKCKQDIGQMELAMCEARTFWILAHRFGYQDFLPLSSGINTFLPRPGAEPTYKATKQEGLGFRAFRV